MAVDPGQHSNDGSEFVSGMFRPLLGKAEDGLTDRQIRSEIGLSDCTLLDGRIPEEGPTQHSTSSCVIATSFEDRCAG